MSPKFIFKVFDCLVRPPILKHVATIGKRARQSILLILLRHYFIPRFYKLIIFLFCSGEVSLSTSGDRSHLQGKIGSFDFPRQKSGLARVLFWIPSYIAKVK